MNKKLGFKILLSNPIGVIMDGIRSQQQGWYRQKIKSTYQIDQLPTIDFLDLVPYLDEDIRSYSFLNGTSLITDLVLLKSMARRFEACAYLEIGSWRGESLVNISEITQDVTSVSLGEQEMRSMKLSEEFIALHGIFAKDLKHIKHIGANSHTFDFAQLNKKFDLIFVDGDHSYQGVLNDSKKVFPLLRDEKSIIVWHDYGFNTEDVRHSTLKGILDGIPRELHHNLYHVSNTMCAVYIPNLDLPTSHIHFPTKPNKTFNFRITGKHFE